MAPDTETSVIVHHDVIRNYVFSWQWWWLLLVLQARDRSVTTLSSTCVRNCITCLYPSDTCLYPSDTCLNTWPRGQYSLRRQAPEFRDQVISWERQQQESVIRDSNGISELTQIQPILPYEISYIYYCLDKARPFLTKKNVEESYIKGSSEIPLLSLHMTTD